jgi:transposase
MQHRSREERQDLVVLRARDALVAARTELINATRGLVKSMGSRLPKCSSPSFAQKVEESIPVELRDALLPLVRMTATLSDCIQGYDEKIEKLGREKYGHTALLQQVKGVGPITALADVLTLEDPNRFVKSRDVGPYLGLVPKQEDSGESQPQLGISKPATRCCAGCWWGARTISWGRSDRTRTYDGMGCGSASAAGRMRRRERQLRWRGSWRCCSTASG